MLSLDQKKEVPFQKIVECFPEISIFTINDAVNDYKNEINKLCIDFFCTHDEFVFLKFNANCIKYYKNILNCGYNEIPLDNILRSLTTTHWRYCFLDLYRCIERLYIIARAKEYKRDFLCFSFREFQRTFDKCEMVLKKGTDGDNAYKR